MKHRSTIAMSTLSESGTCVKENRHMHVVSFRHVNTSGRFICTYIRNRTSRLFSAMWPYNGWALLLSSVFMDRPPSEDLLPYSIFLLDATEAAGFSCQAEIT